MDIKKEVEALIHEAIELRRDFHKHPELGFEEYRTSEQVKGYLEECGIETQNIANTGVIGLLRGGNPGRTILLRADMDALPVIEENEVSYKSINKGKMHACGHDSHVAMLLVAAKILSKYRKKLNGNIKFLFQPDEENGGANILIDEGVLENPHVDAALGIHIWTPLESGKIGISEGPVMATQDNFKIVIKGKGGHTASPHTSIDPILVAANIIQTVQAIQTREINILNPTLIVFGKISGGTAPNIIPGEVELEGSIRYLYDKHDGNKEKLHESFERIINMICKTYGANYELELIPSSMEVTNDSEMAEIVRCAAGDIVDSPQSIVPLVTMVGEDFSEFSSRVPSALYFIGTGNKEKGTDFPHHHPCFDIDEDTIQIGVEMHVRCALQYLNK